MTGVSAAPGFWRRLAVGTGVSLVATVLTLIVFELLLGIYLPRSTAYMVHAPNTRTTLNSPYIHGVQFPSNFQVNSMGVRGREWSSERRAEYRILAVGGSTTKCLVNDQDRVWTALLEKNLGTLPDGRRVWIGNVGVSGISTRHHVAQMKHLLDVYEPDLILLLAGVNDLSSRLKHGERYDPRFMDDPGNVERLINEAFRVVPGMLPGGYPGDSWYRRTRLWFLLRVLKIRILKLSPAQDLEGRAIQDWRLLRARGRIIGGFPLLDTALEEYKRNLKKIVAAAHDRGVRIILMTQPVLWRDGLTGPEKDLLWLGGEGDFQNRPGCAYYDAKELEKGMNAYNEETLRVCAETGALSIDLAAQVPKTTEFFFDDCHFTDKAQVVISHAIASKIVAGWKSGHFINERP